MVRIPLLRPVIVTPLLAVSLTLVVALAACSASDDEGSTTTASPTAGSTTSASSTASGHGYVTVDVRKTFEALNADDGAQIVDVREPDEWANTGVPPGSVLIPLGELEQRAPRELSTDRPVYVICNSGNRSRTGSEILLSMGFTEVYNVAGGIQDWIRSGLPVESYTP